jgi:hypothetical protein
MVGEYVFSNAHNSSLTPKFATYFWPSYFTTQEANVAPKVFATKQVIQTNGLTSASSPITRVKKARAIMPQSFHPFNAEKECTLLAKGEETTIPQAARASNFRVLGVHVIRKTHNFPLINLWSANFKCMKWRKSL